MRPRRKLWRISKKVTRLTLTLTLSLRPTPTPTLATGNTPLREVHKSLMNDLIPGCVDYPDPNPNPNSTLTQPLPCPNPNPNPLQGTTTTQPIICTRPALTWYYGLRRL